jgi:hypothetical protein
MPKGNHTHTTGPALGGRSNSPAPPAPAAIHVIPEPSLYVFLP